LGQKCETLSEKLTKAKRAKDGAQVVGCLPPKHRALSSNPSAGKQTTIVHRTDSPKALRGLGLVDNSILGFSKTENVNYFKPHSLWCLVI
jgi:hypothetical protein